MFEIPAPYLFLEEAEPGLRPNLLPFLPGRREKSVDMAGGWVCWQRLEGIREP